MAARKSARKSAPRHSIRVRKSTCEKDIKALKALAAALGAPAPRVSETDFGTVIAIKGNSSRARKFLYLDGVTLTSDEGDSARVTGWVGFYPARGGAEVTVYVTDMANMAAAVMEPFTGRDADDVVGSGLFVANI